MLWHFSYIKLNNTSNLLPSASGRHDMCLQELFEIIQKYGFSRLRTAFHGARRRISDIALWPFILYRCARYILAGILIHTPTIRCGAIALHALITAIRSTFGHIEQCAAVLKIEKQTYAYKYIF